MKRKERNKLNEVKCVSTESENKAPKRDYLCQKPMPFPGSQATGAQRQRQEARRAPESQTALSSTEITTPPRRVRADLSKHKALGECVAIQDHSTRVRRCNVKRARQSAPGRGMDTGTPQRLATTRSNARRAKGVHTTNSVCSNNASSRHSTEILR